MRYLILAENGVRGPYLPAELSRLPGFSARSFVCPEDRRGQSASDWKPAVEIGELAGLVPRPLAPPPPRRTAFIAEDDGLLDEVNALKRTAALLEDKLRARDAEIRELRREAEGLARLGEEASKLRADLEQSRAASRGAAAESETSRQWRAAVNDELARLRENEALAQRVAALEKTAASTRQELAAREAEMVDLRRAAAFFRSQDATLERFAAELRRLKEIQDRLRTACVRGGLAIAAVAMSFAWWNHRLLPPAAAPPAEPRAPTPVVAPSPAPPEPVVPQAPKPRAVKQKSMAPVPQTARARTPPPDEFAPPDSVELEELLRMAPQSGESN